MWVFEAVRRDMIMIAWYYLYKINNHDNLLRGHENVK